MQPTPLPYRYCIVVSDAAAKPGGRNALLQSSASPAASGGSQWPSHGRVCRGNDFCNGACLGKIPVHCASSPGFIVNRVARPFYGEAFRLLSERAASPATLDAILRETGGFRMGPFALMDLIGHDVNFAVTRSVYDGMSQDARYKPSLVQKNW